MYRLEIMPKAEAGFARLDATIELGPFSFPIIYIRTPELVRDKARNPNKFGHPSTEILRISKPIS